MSVTTEAINILDRGIAYAREHGFNILRYGETHYDAPRCYIGTIKTVGGEELLTRVDAISNPAVKLALDTLDNLYPETLAEQHRLYEGGCYHSGAAIENVGLRHRSLYFEIDLELKHFIQDCQRAKEVLQIQLTEFEVDSFSEEVEDNNHVLVEA